jgi:hypothetical protein
MHIQDTIRSTLRILTSSNLTELFSPTAKVDSTDFFVGSTSSRNSCSVPVLGNAKVTFDVNSNDNDASPKSDYPSSFPSEFVLQVDNATKEDFGWICAKFYECKEMFEGIIDVTMLKSLVANHFNSFPPDTGYDASDAKYAGGKEIEELFADENILNDLASKGYGVIDSAPVTPKLSNSQLSKHLFEKSGQSSFIRSDTVTHIDREAATECGLSHRYDLLMGIASHLNENLEFEDSPHTALRPATEEKPLSIPEGIQLAEFGENDFYKAHSDNSIADEETGVRRSFRSHTCILYCNEGWKAEDGGALRLYLDSQQYLLPDDAKEACDYVDINPQNGRLLIFDSTLVHSVEKVTHPVKLRRALTLWLDRPDDSGVRGEKYDEEAL